MIGGSVYVISDGANARKIGVARNVKSRLSSLQTGVYHKLLIEASYPSDDALMVERVAHHLLREKRIRGEWFDVTDKEAISAVQQAIEFIERGGNLDGLAVAHSRGRPRLMTAVTAAERQSHIRERYRKQLKYLETVAEAARLLVRRERGSVAWRRAFKVLAHVLKSNV